VFEKIGIAVAILVGCSPLIFLLWIIIMDIIDPISPDKIKRILYK